MSTFSSSTSDPRARHRERRDATRAALIESAMRQFHERGYGPTTAAAIASEIGQTKGAFYFHFSSKADCFLAVLEYRQAARGDWYLTPTRFTADATTLEEVLASTSVALLERMEGMPDFALAAIDFWLTEPRTEEIRAAYQAVHEQWLAEITRYIVELQRGGWVDEGLDVESAAYQIESILHGNATQQRLFDIEANETLLVGITKLLRP